MQKQGEKLKRYKVMGISATALVVGVGIFPTTVFASTSPFSGGNGSATNPYQISSQADYLTLEKNSQYWSDHFILTQDVSINTSTHHTPIGNSSTPFTGTFNGNGNTISGLSVSSDSSTPDGTGLFGWTDGATIENLTLSDEEVTGGDDTGGLVGYAGPGTSIVDCTIIGLSTVDGSSNVGGLVGQNAGNIQNSVGQSFISSPSTPPPSVPPQSFGALIGKNDATGTQSGNSVTAIYNSSEGGSSDLPLIGINLASNLAGSLPEVPFAGGLPLLGLTGVAALWYARRRKVLRS